MCTSMVDIQSATAEIRRGKKEERRRIKKKEDTGQKYNGLPYSIRQIIKTNSQLTVRTAHVCVRIIVHNCRTQCGGNPESEFSERLLCKSCVRSGRAYISLGQ